MSDPDDPDLFSYDWTHARRTDPDTSHEAIPVNITAQALRVLVAYWDGDTILDCEAYRRVGLGVARIANQRCSDLRHANLIERTGERGRTPSGKSGYLCRITPAGHEYLAANRWRLDE